LRSLYTCGEERTSKVDEVRSWAEGEGLGAVELEAEAAR